LIVKYRSVGPHALEACAEELSRSGGSFSEASRDGSDSLSRLHERFGIRRHRALFRSSDGRAFAGQRRRLGARLARARGVPAAPALARAESLAHVYRVEVAGPAPVEEVLAALRADPHVEYAQVDHANAIDWLDPGDFDDPFLSSAGSWGQPYADLWGLESMRAADAWPVAQGDGVVVAVVDTGLDYEHPDIAGNVWVHPGEDLDGDGRIDPEEWNGIDDDGNGFVDDLRGFDFANSIDADEDGRYDGPSDASDADPFDDNGHGTHVAGTIAAVGGNGIGIVGVAPAARIMPLKGFPGEGSAPDSVLWRAVLYAAENGASVVNNSWSCSPLCPVNPLAEDVLATVTALGVVVVTSAGNYADDVVFNSPENTSAAITVGSIGADDALSSFSSFGFLLDVVAPGGGPSTPVTIASPRRNILSLLASEASESLRALAVGGAYTRSSGTSMAAPHVTGAVALLLGTRPGLAPSQVRRLLRLAARDLGPPGHDGTFGAGALDAGALVSAPLPDLDFAVDSPRAGALHDPSSGPLRVWGRAAGSDLAELSLAVGRGLEPASFETVPGATGDPGAEGVLATWPVADEPDGPYVLRLRALLRDGRAVDEFSVVGLERNPPLQISDGERDARRPAIFGERVAWDARDASGLRDRVLGSFDSFERSGGGQVLEAEGDQADVSGERRRLAWIDQQPGGAPSFQTCTLRGGDACEPEVVASAVVAVPPPSIERGWLVWTRDAGAELVIEGCRVHESRGCEPRRLVEDADGRWSLLSSDGASLLLRDRTGAARLGHCPLAPDAAPCTPAPIDLTGADTPIRLAHDGSLVAFEQTGLYLILPPGCELGDPDPACAPTGVEFGSRLGVCALDLGAGRCPAAIVSRMQIGGGIDVSGDRIAWASEMRGEHPAISFCEFEWETQRCEIQRVGGIPAAQLDPALDGDRLAWADARDGVVQIRGLALPAMRPLRTLQLRPGQPFAIPLVGERVAGGFALSGIEGLSPEAFQAVVVEVGSGRSLAWGRAPAASAGLHLWRVRGIGEGGLFTQRTLRIEVGDPPKHRPHPGRGRR